ncbi:alanine racemase [uncultured Bifidobacterium sp.]|uniref:alanine racemase n=1 Tax=uncultured Bifidobacterium sp. TaxID=165187 RepID=UPI00258A8B82|nr:alanine racemase [uncultured Bifidobacterium sp.]MEE0654987.1 alanine racemase [Bifidobacterium criceti]
MSAQALADPRFSSPQGEANYHAARRAYPAQAIVDLAVIRDNMRHLVDIVNREGGETQVMGVVKADAYGHGLIPTALAALAGGATWLGTAQAREALLLRHAGIGADRAHILTWVNNPLEAPYRELIDADIDLSAATLTALEHIADAAREAGRPARIHIKVDTGFGRNGFTFENLPEAIEMLTALHDEGVIDIVGQWSHLAVADAPDNADFVEQTETQIARFEAFTQRLNDAGIEPRIRHLANTAATLSRPEIHYDLVRPGVALYGYEADPAMGRPEQYGLKPAMTLQAQLSSVKDVDENSGLSYGRIYLTEARTSVAIVPVGYADGIHRSASGSDERGALGRTMPGGPVRVMTKDGPRLMRVSGRVCMDQFIIDLHGMADDLGVAIGDTVELFGPGRGEAYAEPTADDWARAADTISYEIFTCLRNRVPRLYTHATDVLSTEDLDRLDPASIL